MQFYVLLAFTIFFGRCIVSTRDNVVYRQGNVNVDRTVLLGALIPVHMASNTSKPCGPVRSTAIQRVEAMVWAINTINEDRNLLPNVNLSFDIRDTCSSVSYALQQSVDYIQSSVNLGCSSSQHELSVSSVLGASYSAISEPVANLFGLFKIPQISYGSSASILSNKKQFPFFFRTFPSDKFQSRALADIVIHFNWTYIIALHSDDVYGRDGIRSFRRALLNTSGYCIAIDDIVLQNDPPNYEVIIDKISQIWVRNASVILLFSQTDEALGMLREIKTKVDADSSFPLQNITWLGSDAWATSVPGDLRPMARGMISVTPRSNMIPGFDDYFTSLNPCNNSNNPWFTEYWEQYYSPEECPLKVNITSYSSQVPLIINAVYAVAHAIDYMIHVQCSPSKDLCSEILTGGAIDGELLRQYLLNVSFNNTQEIVQFDENGDVSGAYTVLNLQRSGNQYSFEVIGDWDIKNHLSITEHIEWVGGDEVPQSLCSMPCKNGEFLTQVSGQAECCFTCESCPDDSIVNNSVRCTKCNLGFHPNPEKSECVEIPVTYFMSSSPLAIVILTMTCIGIVATIFVIVVFAIFFKHAIIKASSRELSGILLAGLLLCFILPFLYVIKPSAAICGIQRFFIGFCFTISYSALLVKTNRIHRIFNQNPSKKPRFIDPLSQIIITCFFITVQVVIASIWLAADPPTVKIARSRDSNEIQCKGDDNMVVGFLATFVYNFFLLIISTYFAFRTRSILDNFNEAKFINVTLYTSCIIWVVFITVFFCTQKSNTILRTFFLMIVVVLSAGTTLCCLFISKVIILFTHIQEEKEITRSSQLQSVGDNSSSVLRQFSDVQRHESIK